MTNISNNLKLVNEKILNACAKRSAELGNVIPRLVAVSKTKPPNLIIEAYEHGQRNFGENYVKELVDKANHPDLKIKDIQWHFIGHLQKNKVNKVVSIPNLYMIESINSEKLASIVDSAWGKYRKDNETLLRIMIQVNTSREEEKSGCEISQTSKLVQHVLNTCKNIKLVGLMTIGAYGYDLANGPNPDFLILKKLRDEICEELKLSQYDLGLSMGMSTDYEHAIELGSTNVRVGSAIFGERPPKP